MKTDRPFLNQQRQISDVNADALAHHFFEMKAQSTVYQHLQMTSKQVVKENNPALKKFLCTARPAPQWFDPARLVRGQKVFEKYALPIMTLLGGLALPYCYAGSPGNKALYFSEKMRQSPGKRLADTADFILSVCTPRSFEENEGSFSINRTRLIHAIARYHIRKKEGWDLQWGMPINQEDMAGTNLAFSYIVLTGLQKSAHVLSDQEKEDFLFLWRYIGYQLHISQDLLPGSFSEAMELERVIRTRHFKKSMEGEILTRELLQYYKSVVKTIDGYLLDSQIRYWLGDSVADCLGLPEHPVKDKIVQTINSFRELGNLFGTNANSYKQMLEQHHRLKQE